ncbi:uracil-DNA glycosylase [Omnitrophica bacterium]|nr:uracil-DNA glycosylase [Candidatus Omnitrophota bacterium]
MSIDRELFDIVRSIKSYIALEKNFGIAEYTKATPAGEAQKTEDKKSKEAALESLEMEVFSCKRCGLCTGRNNVVFGAGNPDADLMFIGEAPGYEEDMQGLPFVGRAGQLLTKIIEAMGLRRKDVYIANVIKCRPPQNRNPLPTEMLACEEHLVRQVEIIRPRAICALGKVSAQALLKTQETISKLRGKFYSYRGIKLMPTFHPAYLLRNPNDKKLVWHDVKKIMAGLR